ncbi:MAG TPA: trypsin-like peptidase domain-containing protein [Blastocatellia bacterium]|nr:trypsin-like peptidase domain-containing protein [Blastocatellia bacterium]
MDLPETSVECDRARPLINATKRLAQVKVMIKQLITTSLALLALLAAGSSLSARAHCEAAYQLRNEDRATGQAAANQDKTVVLDVTSIAERVNEVVVNVRSSSEGGENLGSGFIIDRRGLIATNFHLISNSEPRRGSGQRGPEPKVAPKLVNNVTVTLHDGRQFPASIKGYDEATDIALLEIVPSGPQLPVADLGDSDSLRVGEWVIAIGNPLGLDHTVTLGIVSAKGRTGFGGQFDDFLQTDAAINPGNSGGPLLNAQGKIVGINTLVLERTQGLSFAIPINTLKSILSQLIDRGRVTRGFIGVETQDIDADIRGFLKLGPDSRGVRVIRAERATPAARAGLRKDDLITNVDDQAITSAVQFNRIIASKPPGTKVVIRIMRDGREYALNAEIGEETKNK